MINDGALAATGLQSFAETDSPVAKWTYVYIPYCTGDLHWGDADVLQEASLMVAHRGAVNARAALNWLFRERAANAVKQILVTGCSAGAYGSILWSAHIARQYPQAQMVQLGDSGAGVVPQAWLNSTFSKWNVSTTEGIPYWVPGLNLTETELKSTSVDWMYTRIAEQYRNATFSQFNRQYDMTQVKFYTIQGGQGGAPSWSQGMLQSTAKINVSTTNYYGFTTTGYGHCITSLTAARDFQTLQAGGTKFVDWLRQLLAGTPKDVFKL